MTKEVDGIEQRIAQAERLAFLWGFLCGAIISILGLTILVAILL